MLAGYLADLALGDPKRGHPVAVFGHAAASVERFTYRDSHIAGALHVGLLVGAVGLLGAGLQGSVAATALATWMALGGTTLARTGVSMAELLERDDIEAARRLLPSLCGRDPARLDSAGLARAALESVAENTSDAEVAPLLWAAVGGVPAVLAYRGINTLDAMIGHRSPRYCRFGWAAARLDDAANFVDRPHDGGAGGAVRTGGGRIAVGGGAGLAPRRRAPSQPQRGRRRGGLRRSARRATRRPTHYHHELQIRPTLGDGTEPTVADLRRAVQLSRAVQAVCAAVVFVTGATLASARKDVAFARLRATSERD